MTASQKDRFTKGQRTASLKDFSNLAAKVLQILHICKYLAKNHHFATVSL